MTIECVGGLGIICVEFDESEVDNAICMLRV